MVGMSRLLACLLVLAPSAAVADYFPYVGKGPTLVGVGPTEAWVAWYTVHHQGESSFLNECYNDALTGTPNDEIPTVKLALPNGSFATFEDANCSRFHRVHLVNLQPDTAYAFTLDKPRTSGGANAEGSFRTAPASSAGSLKFVVYGDNRDTEITQASTRADHEALVAAILARDADAAFLLNTGDFALNLPAVSGDDRGYTEFWEVEQALLTTHPLFVAFGNHESIDTAFFDGLFSLGKLSGAAHPYYYSFDWGPAHVAILNAFEGDYGTFKGNAPALSDAQATWLDQDLAAAKAKGLQLFILSHQGAYSYGADDKAHGGGPDVKSKVVPLMLKYGALTIFAGHDHYYQRGREDCVGFNVVGAGGAPMYDPDTTHPSVLKAVKTPSYLVVTVTPTSAKGEARDSQGQVIDSFDFVPGGCAQPDAGSPPDAATAADTGPVVAADAASPRPDAAAAVDAASAGRDAMPSGLDAQATAVPDAGSTVAPAEGCQCGSAGAAIPMLLWGLLLAVAGRHRRS